MEYTYVPSDMESIPDDKVSELYNAPQLTLTIKTSRIVCLSSLRTIRLS